MSIKIKNKAVGVSHRVEGMKKEVEGENLNS